jgi:hypothetical protein
MAAALLGVLLTAELAGCQDATRVGAHNACGFPIEVSMEDTESVSSDHWSRVDDGEHPEVSQATESMTQSVVFVRRAEGGPVSHFTVLRQDHTRAPGRQGLRPRGCHRGRALPRMIRTCNTRLMYRHQSYRRP